ncbi:MAG: hypothetical protein WAL61_01060 [Acidimicrobiales bacterium]
MRRRIPLRLLASCTPVLLGTVTLWSAAAPAGASTPTAAQLLSDSVDAAMGANSLHFVDKTVAGKVHQTLVGNVSAATAGEQVTSSAAPVTVELIDGVAYVQAGTSVLQSSLGLPAAGAQTGNGKWIAVHPADAAFSELTQDLTIGSEVNSYIPVTHLKMGKVHTLAGRKVVTISGTAPSSASNNARGARGTAFLVVPLKAPYLPIEAGLTVNSSKGSFNEAAAFTDWNAKITITPPPNPILYSSLLG